MILNKSHIAFDVGYLRLKDPKSKAGHANSDTYKNLIQKAVWMKELSKIIKTGCLSFPLEA